MKKYLLIALLFLTMTLVACGSDEIKDTDVKNSATDQTEVEVPNDAEEPVEPDTSVSDEDTSENPYEGIDMESTLPGKEWIQTTFPGVIDTPKIVIYNDATNRKTIVEEGEIVVYNESDTFAVYLPDGCTIVIGSYLVSKATVDKNYEEEVFDMEILKEEYQLWKNIDGGALYEVTLNNNGTEEVLKCMISLGD